MRQAAIANNVNSNTTDWLAQVCYGEGLQPLTEKYLKKAALAYANDDEAELFLQAAAKEQPGHFAVQIGFYRYYFYKGRLADALLIAEQCLREAADLMNIPCDWRDVKREHAIFDDYLSGLPRFYMFTLKAYGYLQMRLDNIETGHEVLMKLKELDPGDRLGASALLAVVERRGNEDDGEYD